MYMRAYGYFSQIKLLAVGVVLLGSTGAIAYVTHKISAAGRAEVEMRQLTEINQRNLDKQENMTRLIEKFEKAERKAIKRLSKLNITVGDELERLTDLPIVGEDMICQLDCTLP